LLLWWVTIVLPSIPDDDSSGDNVVATEPQIETIDDRQKMASSCSCSWCRIAPSGEKRGQDLALQLTRDKQALIPCGPVGLKLGESEFKRERHNMGVLDTFSLAGKLALVTGGSRGIGQAIAQALGEAGARVVVTARTDEAAESAAERLRSLGIDAFGRRLEVTDVDLVEAVVADVTATIGPIDVLVNNAGISVAHTALETDNAVWRSILDTNVDGVWHCSRAVARGMAERGGGTIVNIGSMSAQIVNQPRWQPAYLTSKAAVHQLTKALAAEWAPLGIRVNAIAPGYIETDQSPVYEPQYKPWCVDPAPMKRAGRTEELGPVAVFLASDASSFMTGSIVVADGGFTLF
jgi:NAD(P)-dependent dehydrogenase (short-subunit alcohol dehydrogenase family)